MMVCIRKKNASLGTPFFMVENKGINRVVILTDPDTFIAGIYDVHSRRKIRDLIFGDTSFRIEIKEEECKFYEI